MSAEFRPFKAKDLDSFEVQGAHKMILQAVKLRPLAMINAEDSLWSFTMWADGKPRACAGADGEGGLWVFLAPDLKKHMVSLTRYGMAMIDAHRRLSGPVHAEIDPSHKEAVRWVRLAGFRQINHLVWVYP